jgi:tRNA A37 methylthiotransferase MiaB
MAKIFVEAYGCSASFSDSEMISGLILNGGHTLVDNSSESDLNIVVTCSVKDATANKFPWKDIAGNRLYIKRNKIDCS